MLAAVGLGSPFPLQVFPGLCGLLLPLTHFPLLQYRGHLICGSGWLDPPDSGWKPHRGLRERGRQAFDLVVWSELLVLVFVLFYFYIIFVMLK